MTKPRYLIISGPTASGKTSTAIKVASSFKSQETIEVVNFDSLLFYKELNIGTAKPSSEEQEAIPHHLIDITSIQIPMNASSFAQQCEKVLATIWERNHIPLLVGGSGFYLKALMEGMYPGGTPSDEVRKEVQQILSTKGLQEVIKLLKKNDPQSLEKIHANDEYRLTRALEFFLHSGQPISVASKVFEEQKEKLGLGLKRKAKGLHLHLDIPKDEHFPIIEKRTKQMLTDGLINETKDILNKDYVVGNEKPLLSIGYKEVMMFLDEKLSSLDELEERINISTRQLAKAQRTWFNNNPGDYTFDCRYQYPSLLEKVQAFLG